MPNTPQLSTPRPCTSFLGVWLFLGLWLTPALSSAAIAQNRPEVRTFAVRTFTGASNLTQAVQSGSFQRYASRNENVDLVVGEGVSGDINIEAHLFPADDHLQKKLIGLPVQARGDAFSLGGTAYPNSDSSLALRLADSSWVVIGYQSQSVAALVDRVLWSQRGRTRRGSLDGDYLVWEHADSYRSGHWQQTEEGFTIDPNERNDMATRAALYAAQETVSGRGVVLRVPAGYGKDPIASALLGELDTAAFQMASRLGMATRPSAENPLTVVVERDFVEMGRHLANIGETVLTADGDLHIVYHPGDLDAYRYGLARALIRRAGLELAPRLEDGAALWLSRQWYGRDYQNWLPDLAHARVFPTAEEIFADDSRVSRTDVLWPPVSAALLDHLPGATLSAKLRPFVAQKERLQPRITQLLLSLERRLSVSETDASETDASETDASETDISRVHPTKHAALAFQNGISFAMRNGLDVGYHTPGVEEQLTRLQRLGSNSISLMPFAGQETADSPDLRIYNNSPGSETDVGMIFAARKARKRGLLVLWKPHIWVSHESWPGEIVMPSEADWATWWRTYRRYILRHAMLAEFAGSELFSIGVELGKTLVRESDWRHLIHSVRRVYSGRVTYSGNWWGDYDQVPFWDQLDYVGVDAYFPLASDAEADRQTLEAGARRAVDQLRRASEKFGKPVLLTEVGFSARRGAWVSPHEEGGEYSEEHQALAYEVLLEVLGRPSWLAGIYPWKVFSHPTVSGGQRPDFQFLGRQAESVVRNYFNAR